MPMMIKMMRETNQTHLSDPGEEETEIGEAQIYVNAFDERGEIRVTIPETLTIGPTST